MVIICIVSAAVYRRQKKKMQHGEIVDETVAKKYKMEIDEENGAQKKSEKKPKTKSQPDVVSMESDPLGSVLGSLGSLESGELSRHEEEGEGKEDSVRVLSDVPESEKSTPAGCVESNPEQQLESDTNSSSENVNALELEDQSASNNV